jgi:hypothetical protein
VGRGILFARNGRLPQNPRISSSSISYIIYCADIKDTPLRKG